MCRAESRRRLKRGRLGSTRRPPSEAQRQGTRSLELPERACRFNDKRRLVFAPITIAVASGEKQGRVRQNGAIELGPGLRKDDGLGGAVEVFQNEPGVLFAGFLRDLPFHARDHRAHAHLMFAPLTQGRSRSGSEELDLVAIAFQRMARDEEAEDLLFLGEPLRFGPGGDVG
jgi:hypothetical protein